MAIIPSLVRRYSFTASHFYHNAAWSDEQNREVFGAFGTPHPHDFTLELTVSGPIDPDTGFLVDVEALDRLVKERIVSKIAGTVVNRTIPALASGTVQPTMEVLVGIFWEELADRMPGAARLHRIRLFEDETLGAECADVPVSAP